MPHPHKTSILDNIYKNILELSLLNLPKEFINFLEELISEATEELLGPQVSPEDADFTLYDLGQIRFPSISFGNVISHQLINLHELLVFKIYSIIKGEYSFAIDVGANVGLHSIVMSRAGFRKVVSIEADPNHIQDLRRNLSQNDVENVEIHNVAISDIRGEKEFVRLLGNLTGSFVAGSKSSPYGDTEITTVVTKPITDYLQDGQKCFIKMDVESHESTILKSCSINAWNNMDLLLEIGNPYNAQEIFEYCQRLGLHLFSEKKQWKTADKVDEVPSSWREGSAIISQNPDFMKNLLALLSREKVNTNGEF